MVSIYFLALYSTNTKDKKSLYFALLCFFSALRQSSVTGEIILKQVFVDIPWELVVKMEFISLFCLVSIALMYLTQLFIEESNPRINRFVNSTNIALIILVLFTPAAISSYVIPTYLILTGALLVYMFTIMLQAFSNKRLYSGWFTLGYVPIMICGVNDILYS